MSGNASDASDAGDANNAGGAEEELTLDELTLEAAGDDLSAAEVGAARDRAREIVDEARGGEGPNAGAGLEGLQDMHALSLAIGLQVPRVLFEQMVAGSTAGRRKKAAWRRRLAAMSDVTEAGCIRADFRDAKTGEKETAFLVLGECGADHDLGAEIDKVFARIAEADRAKIREHLSMLLYLGRSAYGQMMVQMRPLLAEIGKKLPAGFDPRALGVDPANTTLFLDLPGARRAGIFVRLSAEVEAEKAAEGTATTGEAPGGA